MSGDIWDNALLSFDEALIRNTARKLHVILPDDKKAFWTIVAAAIKRNKHSTPFDRMTADNIMRELA